MTEKILLTILGSGNIILFIKFMIERHDRKKERAEDNELGGIRSKLKKLEKDGIRTQLLLLILLKAEEQTEILKVAEYYFCDLHANWYMTGMFKKWADERGLEPEWFDPNDSRRGGENLSL